MLTMTLAVLVAVFVAAVVIARLRPGSRRARAFRDKSEAVMHAALEALQDPYPDRGASHHDDAPDPEDHD